MLLLFIFNFLIQFLVAFEYPQVKRDESTKENYSGVEITDAYQWLEDPFSQETKNFIIEQNILTTRYLNSLPIQKIKVKELVANLIPKNVDMDSFSESEPNFLDFFNQLAQSEKGFNFSKCEVLKTYFLSKDKSIQVPITIYRKKNQRLDGQRPTVLFGYGGFNVEMKLSMWSVTLTAAFVIQHLDGIFAMTYLRGDNKYGKAWHSDGMVWNKQNVFDDFHCASEYLVQQNFTIHEKIIAMGGSNGGLLVGASINQRPELFKCAVPVAGVMDMLRFPLFTPGGSWKDEYGDPKEEVYFKDIIKYSPLHSIPKNPSQFPNVLAKTHPTDRRVVPMHSYKYMAQLQHQLGRKFPQVPFLLRALPTDVHDSVNSQERVEDITDTVLFILDCLGINQLSN